MSEPNAELLAKVQGLCDRLDRLLATGVPAGQEYLTAAEAGRLCNRTAKQIRQAVQRRELAGGGKPLRVRRADLDAWLTRQQRPVVDRVRAKRNPYGLA